jgi:predicted MFS family arabinose efflux permease
VQGKDADEPLVGRIYLQLSTFFHQRRITGASLMALAFFFTFISTFTYIPHRIQEAPFLLSNSAVSLLYLVYFVGFFVPPWARSLSHRNQCQLCLPLDALCLMPALSSSPCKQEVFVLP